MKTQSPSNFAVIYARYSSNNQREESIDAQLRACKEYAERNGYIIIDTYCDSAKSGTSAEREAFQKMIADGDEKKFNYVLVHKLDRFSRDKYDSVHYKRKLRNNNIRVISCLEHLTDDPESIMLESVLEGVSQYYSANLSREVMKGLRENALTLRHTGGTPILGLSVEPETLKYKINEEEATIVRTIFEMYANNNGYSEILRVLKNNNYKTKVGNDFTKSSINKILQNEKYRGVFIYNRKKEYDVNRKRRPVLKDKSEVIRIENGLPQIIDDTTFFKVQHILTKNKLLIGTFNAKRTYLLSGGLLRCDLCKASLSGNSRTGGRRTSMYTSYRCSSKSNKKGCNCKEIRQEYIENFAIDELNNFLFSTDDKNSIKAMKIFNEKKKQEIALANIEHMKELDTINSEISNILSLVSKGSLSFLTVQDTLEKFESRKLKLIDEIERIKTNNFLSQTNFVNITELIKDNKETLLNKDFEKCKVFIDEFIDTVVVSNESVTANYKFTLNDCENFSVTLTREELYSRYKYLIKK